MLLRSLFNLWICFDYLLDHKETLFSKLYFCILKKVIFYLFIKILETWNIQGKERSKLMNELCSGRRRSKYFKNMLMSVCIVIDCLIDLVLSLHRIKLMFELFCRFSDNFGTPCCKIKCDQTDKPEWRHHQQWIFYGSVFNLINLI